MSESKRMHVDLRMGESLIVGGARIRLEKKSGQVARLVIETDGNTTVINPQSARRSALQSNELEHKHG